MLTGLSTFWFERTNDLVANHLISVADGVPDEARGRGMVVRKLEMLPVECVVRGYITGSGWKDYQQTGAVSGIELPSGLRESDQLPEPLFTPSTKADVGHDEAIDFEGAVELVGDRELTERVRDVSIALYQHAADHARANGIILADTKFELGLDEDGTLTLGDEVCTPDSSRFWPADQYEPGRGQPSFDKQYVRDWASSTGWDRTPPAPAIPDDIVERTRAKYVEAYERVTGEPFDELVAPHRGLMRARVLVRPKQGILDPQGQAVQRALPALGFTGVDNVHIGRLIELDVEDPSQLPEMCERLLANPLIEDYEIVESIAEPAHHVKFGVIRFPGLVRRDRRARRRGARRRGGAAVARRPRPPGRRRGDRPGRLLLRRLPARRSDRAVCAGDGRGRRVRARGRPRARHLQRLSGPVRGAPAPGRAASQRLAEVHLPPGRARGRQRRHRLHRRLRSRATGCRSPSSTPPAASTPPTTSSTGSRRPGRSCCATRPATTPTARRRDIAGVRNERGNVFGLMPHPEHAVDPLTGSTDGLKIFESMRAYVGDPVLG